MRCATPVGSFRWGRVYLGLRRDEARAFTRGYSPSTLAGLGSKTTAMTSTTTNTRNIDYGHRWGPFPEVSEEPLHYAARVGRPKDRQKKEKPSCVGGVARGRGHRAGGVGNYAKQLIDRPFGPSRCILQLVVAEVIHAICVPHFGSRVKWQL